MNNEEQLVKELKKYIKTLIFEDSSVKVIVKDGTYYQGKFLGMSEVCILFKDKFGGEIFFTYDDIVRVVPTKPATGGVS